MAIHGRKPHALDLRRQAMIALAGVGNREHEWHEWTGYAYHVRRRLTAEEQQVVGPAVDLRGDPEGLARFEAARPWMTPWHLALAREELGKDAIEGG